MNIATFAVLATAVPAGVPHTMMTAVTVTSMAPGAAIFIDDRQVGVTPARIALSSRRDYELTVRGTGGEHTCRIEPRAAIVILGVVASPAWLVDLANGTFEWDFDVTLPG